MIGNKETFSTWPFAVLPVAVFDSFGSCLAFICMTKYHMVVCLFFLSTPCIPKLKKFLQFSVVCTTFGCWWMQQLDCFIACALLRPIWSTSLACVWTWLVNLKKIPQFSVARTTLGFSWVQQFDVFLVCCSYPFGLHPCHTHAFGHGLFIWNLTELGWVNLLYQCLLKQLLGVVPLPSRKAMKEGNVWILCSLCSSCTVSPILFVYL